MEKDIINWDMVLQTEPIKELVKQDIFRLYEVSRKIYKNGNSITSISYIVSDTFYEVIFKSKASSGSFRVMCIIEHYNSHNVFTSYEITEFNNESNREYEHDLIHIHVFKEM